jgi:hypothetical protein
MDEFGQRSPDSVPDHPEDDEQYAPSPPSEESHQAPTPPQASRAKRETMPSPAPFAHYANPPNDQLPVPGSDRKARGWRRERQDVPQILVSPPTMDAANGGKPSTYVEEQSAGCCKCVVM